jgi:hypothetical protein
MPSTMPIGQLHSQLLGKRDADEGAEDMVLEAPAKRSTGPKLKQSCAPSAGSVMCLPMESVSQWKVPVILTSAVLQHAPVTVAALLHAQVAAWQPAPVGNKAVSQLI